jgi:hypothetical protein
MLTTLENATQKSITRPTRSVHHAGFLRALCHAPRYCMGPNDGRLCPRPRGRAPREGLLVWGARRVSTAVGKVRGPSENPLGPWASTPICQITKQSHPADFFAGYALLEPRRGAPLVAKSAPSPRRTRVVLGAL